MMRKTIKRFIPRVLLRRLKRGYNLIILKNNYKKDMKIYSKYSYELSKGKTKRHLETDLIFFYHKIEKGLSLPNPRIGFGQKNIEYLLKLLKKYETEYGWDSTAQATLNTLHSYYNFNKKNGLLLDELFSEIEKLNKLSSSHDANYSSRGGATLVKKTEIDEARVNFKEFSSSRYSLRNFSPGEIPMSLIREAVEIAQKTPSVCNRQSSKVYVYEGNTKKNILKHQNGNAGFGDTADKVLLITVEIQDFRGPKERNQAYIDGGLFSMSLIYALHSLGIGSCALNLSLDHNNEQKLKNEAGVPKSEVTMMMLAIGNFPEEFYVADSPRRNIEDVLTII